MIKNTITITCNSCETETFVESGESITRGTVVPNAQKAGWRYVNASEQICPACLAKAAAEKAATKVEAKPVAKETKKASAKVSTKKVSKPASKPVSAGKKVANTASFSGGQSIGKKAKSAKSAS